jgi:hypothetical protein
MGGIVIVNVVLRREEANEAASQTLRPIPGKSTLDSAISASHSSRFGRPGVHQRSTKHTPESYVRRAHVLYTQEQVGCVCGSTSRLYIVNQSRRKYMVFTLILVDDCATEQHRNRRIMEKFRWSDGEIHNRVCSNRYCNVTYLRHVLASWKNPPWSLLGVSDPAEDINTV